MQTAQKSEVCIFSCYNYLSRPTKTQKWRTSNGKTNDTGAAPQGQRPNGNCIALDDGAEFVCVQSISYSLICKWFVNAVLPTDKALYAEIMGQGVKRCVECGAAFAPGSNRAKYCVTCARRSHRRQKNASDRKRRDNADK